MYVIYFKTNHVLYSINAFNYLNITLTKQKKQKTKKSFNESFIERFFYCVIIESLTQKYRSVIISLLDFIKDYLKANVIYFYDLFVIFIDFVDDICFQIIFYKIQWIENALNL